MSKQNSWIYLAIGAVFLMGAFFIFSRNKTSIPGMESEVEVGAAMPIVPATEGSEQEAMSEKVLEMGPDENSAYDDSKRVFSQIMEDSAACLEVKTPNLPEDAPVGLQSFVMQYANDLGPAGPQTEKSTTWYMKGKDGREMRLRLENRFDEEGQSTKTLESFKIGDDGIPIVQDLDPELGINPSKETIDRLLAEGQLQYTEKSGFVAFPTGDRIDYVEKDGSMTEIEFVKGDKFFRCGNIKERESCQCLK